MDSITNRVVIGTRVVAVKDPGTPVIAERRSRPSNIVDMVGDEAYMRPIVIKPGAPDTAHIEADDVHVIAAVVPSTAIDDVTDNVGFPLLVRNIGDVGIRQS